jgi:hypothetical protein
VSNDIESIVKVLDADPTFGTDVDDELFFDRVNDAVVDLLHGHGFFPPMVNGGALGAAQTLLEIGFRLGFHAASNH